ncbi:MAG TPA: polysaccharide biosynthesis C-terminal domain-containing protein [Niastella sp.]
MSLVQSIYEKMLKSDLPPAERSRLIKGIVNSFIIQGFSMVLVFAGNYLLVKFFGAEKYGVYVHVFNWISILTILAANGQEDVVLSRVPKYLAQNNLVQTGAVIKHANVRIAISGIGISLFFLLLIYIFPINKLSEYRFEFLVASLAIYLSAFLSVNQIVLQSLNHIRLSQVIERLLKPFLFTVFISVAALLSFYIDASRLIMIAVINLAICALVLGFIVIKKTKWYFSNGTERYRGEGVSKQTFYFLAISLLQLLTTKIGMLIMPYFTQEKAIGVFNIAARFSDLIIYPFYLLHAVLPQLFAKHHDSSPLQKQKLYTESTWLIIITSLPLLLLNLGAGTWLLGYFGEAFKEGYPALVYMSISNSLFALFGPANTILMMQGKEKLSAIALLVYVLLLTVLSRLLIPVQGITGAALAMLISNVVYNILLAVYAHRHTGVSAPLFRLFEKRRGA